MGVVNTTAKTHDWIVQLLSATLVIYFYVFMEWLFFVTKPSFMSARTFMQNLQVSLVAPLAYIIPVIALLLIFWMLSKASRKHLLKSGFLLAGWLLIALILASSLFLLIDNFTYTMFNVGVVSTEGGQVWIYGFLFLILIVLSYRFLITGRTKISEPGIYRKLVIVTPCMVLVSVFVSLFSLSQRGTADRGWSGDAASRAGLPNVILLSSDGLNAEHMSAYGYHRDTTPFIDELAEQALLCENCFTNAGVSGASIASTLTGKLPTQTRVIYPPYFLKGEDSYQHLPGILKRYGYRNIDISIRHHADAMDMNMLDSFDWANFREIRENAVSKYVSRFPGVGTSYLLKRMIERITERMSHAFGMSKMEHPLNEVVHVDKKFNKDGERVEFLVSTILTSPTPFFAHVHLLETHGPLFYPSKRIFSRGKRQGRRWMTDWYDDAILDFDGRVERIVQSLRERGILHSTVMVICSDHGQAFTVSNRLPLIFIFPRGDHRGRIRANTQNLDIAATILDYLDIEQPDWMGGVSLLSNDGKHDRFIFTVDPKHCTLQTSKSKLGPPFYSLVTIGAFFHHKYYELNVRENTLTVSEIQGHTSPCSEDECPDPEQVGRLLIEHLAENGYDTSSIRIPLTVDIVP